MRHKSMTAMAEVALMAAVLCVLAPLSLNLPISPVPVTLGLFAVYLAAVLLGPKRGTLSVLLYLLLGGIGVPVFSNFSAGFQRLVGPTGGYLVGYLPCAFLIGCLVGKGRKRWIVPVALAAGTAVLYLFGTVWLYVAAGYPSFFAACAVGILPYLLPDAVKIALASVIAVPVKRVLEKNGLSNS